MSMTCCRRSAEPKPAFDRQRAAMREAETLFFLLTDHLGSTAVTANGSGTRTGELWYKPWGEYRGTAYGTTPTSFRFTGQREDATIGLYFYNARYYDPVLGRFIQPDTIVPEPGNPGSLNRYSYVMNNPLRYTDPTGMFTEEEIMNYLGVKTWEEVLKMFEKGGIYEGQWGWLEVLHTAEIGDSVFFMPETGNPWQPADSATFSGAFADLNGQIMLLNSQGVSVDPASVLRASQHQAYVITRPGSEEYGLAPGAPGQGLLRYIEDKQYQHLHVYPQNLHTDFISLWHYADLVGMGAATISLGIGMIGLGMGLCTTGVGCVASGMLIVPGVGAMGGGFGMFYGLKVELEHQHVYERRP